MNLYRYLMVIELPALQDRYPFWNTIALTSPEIASESLVW